MRRIVLPLILLATLCTAAGCASTPEDRGPWHQYLHDHKLE